MKDAKDVVFTTIEMELAWKEATRAFNDCEEKKKAHEKKLEGKTFFEAQAIQKGFILVEDPKTLEEFTEARMKDFAEVSHGDVVLIEGKELMRIPGNYQKDKQYKSKD